MPNKVTPVVAFQDNQGRFFQTETEAVKSNKIAAIYNWVKLKSLGNSLSTGLIVNNWDDFKRLLDENS